MTGAKALHVPLPDAVSTERWAAGLAKLCGAGDCIALSGPLGAGKTTFARGFIRQLAGDVEVTSPTFTLLQPYETKAGTLLWHADLYRLKGEAELAELGLEEALSQGILLVEWPEIAVNVLPLDRLPLTLELAENDVNTRILVGNPPVAWYSRLKEGNLIT